MDDPVVIDPIADKSWDVFVEAHPYGWVSHLSGWKRVVERSFPRTKAYHVALYDKGRIVAGVPVYLTDGLLQKRRFISIPMSTICDLLAETDEQGETLVRFLEDQAKEKRVRFLEIRTLNSTRFLANGGFTGTYDYKHHFLRLNKSPERLMKTFDRTCVRQRINRANSSGVVVRKAAGEADIRALYLLYLITRKRLGLPPQPYDFIRTLWETFSGSGHLTINLAIFENRAIAAILLFKLGKRLSAEYLVSDERYRDHSPNHLLIWDAIQYGCREGCEIFDFGRTHAANKSLMDFKKRWGTEVVDIPIHYYPNAAATSGAPGKDGSAYSWGIPVMKKVPMPLFRMIGQFYYGYLA